MKRAAAPWANTPTLPNKSLHFQLKAALISCGRKQPKVTATGESGMVDEIEEKPWNVYGSNAWPDKKDAYWRQVRAGSPGGSRTVGGPMNAPVAMRTERASETEATMRVWWGMMPYPFSAALMFVAIRTELPGKFQCRLLAVIPLRPSSRLGWSSRTKCPTSNHHRSVFFSAFVMRRPRSSIARADPSSTVVCCWTVVVHDRAVICYRWLFAMPLDDVAPWYFSPIPSATSQCARHWIAA